MSIEDKLKNLTLKEEVVEEAPKPARRGRKKKNVEVKREIIVAPTPDHAIAELVKMPFELWASSQKIEALKLLDDEALTISTPAKTLLDYYMPKNSPVVGAWVCLGITISGVMIKRLNILSKEREKNGKKNKPDNGEKRRRQVNTNKELDKK